MPDIVLRLTYCETRCDKRRPKRAYLLPCTNDNEEINEVEPVLH